MKPGTEAGGEVVVVVDAGVEVVVVELWL